MRYYKVYTMGTKDYETITSQEVVELVAAKAKGVEMKRIRDIFFVPKYITKISPNLDMNRSYPKGDYSLGKGDPEINALLTGPNQKLLE